MTRITEDEQQSIDFDWFCVDEVGDIGHFTTAGFKRLPRSVERSAEDLKLLKEFFQKGFEGGRGYKLDVDLSREIQAPNSGAGYLRDFVYMADKGLYSFDIETYLRPGSYYFRVAVPLIPLQFEELPRHVREILSQTQLTGRLLRDTSRIPYENTLAI